MKILLIIVAVVAVLGLAQLVLLGLLGGMGPLRGLKDKRIAKMPGNAAQYSFDRIVPLQNSPLAGKRLCVLGSSVVYGAASRQSAVGEYLAARFGCTLTKEAVGGTTLAKVGQGSYVERLQTQLDPSAGFDLFICQLSTNDAGKKLPLGEISDGTELADFDTATVTGALEYIICYAKQTWGCPVVFFTGSRYENQEYGAMVARLLELQKKWSVGVLNLWKSVEFNELSAEARALYMADGVHPTKAGYRDWWGPELERQLCDYLAKEAV